MFFKLPSLLQEIAFFLILIAALLTLNKLNSRLEIAVMRSVGISIWKILSPLLLTSFLIGVFWVTVFNPNVSRSKSQKEKYDRLYLGGAELSDTINHDAGLWLRETDQNGGVTVIKATKISKTQLTFFDVEFFILAADKQLLKHIIAKNAELRNGMWHMQDVLVKQVKKPVQQLANYRLASELDPQFILQKIKNNYAETSELSFWALPATIKSLQASGFSATRYKVYLQSLLSLPFLFMAMSLLAACFALLPPRSRKAGILFVAALGLSFIIFFLKNIIISFGATARLNYIIAGWVPTLIVLSAAIYYLLNKEEYKNKVE